LDSGYDLQCKNSVGGVKTVYLYEYGKLSRKNYRVVANQLVSAQGSIIYRFNTLKNASYSETGNVSNTGDSFSQTLNINFSKIGELYHFENLIKKRLRAIIEDNNGKFWILGLENGLTTSAYTKQTGASKTELNGYNITLSGMERLEAPYMDALSPEFGTIEDLFLSSSVLPSSTSKKSSDKFI
tara:strand:- start:6452 stop:7003 length:552 start_codon:yes stop_codon:yes gene_type:complete